MAGRRGRYGSNRQGRGNGQWTDKKIRASMGRHSERHRTVNALWVFRRYGETPIQGGRTARIKSAIRKSRRNHFCFIRLKRMLPILHKVGCFGVNRQTVFSASLAVRRSIGMFMFSRLVADAYVGVGTSSGLPGEPVSSKRSGGASAGAGVSVRVVSVSRILTFHLSW